MENTSRFYLRGSKVTVEKESQITDWQILFHGDELEDVLGFFEVSIKDRKNEFWDWKHIEILDLECKQHVYYFQHKWLPDNDWFRLRPVYEKIQEYVKPVETPVKIMTAEDIAAFHAMATGEAAQ